VVGAVSRLSALVADVETAEALATRLGPEVAPLLVGGWLCVLPAPEPTNQPPLLGTSRPQTRSV
jgi:hypothetical protein